MTLFVLEPLDQSHGKRLFTAFGADYIATRFGWLSLPLSLTIGIAVALWLAPVDHPVTAIAAGVAYGVLIVAASFAHSIGHVLSSRWANGPVTYVRWSATVATMHYDDEVPPPARVDILRSIGGPALNLLLGLLALLFHVTLLQSHLLLWFAAVNLAFAALTISPVPTLDGAAILRALARRRNA